MLQKMKQAIGGLLLVAAALAGAPAAAEGGSDEAPFYERWWHTAVAETTDITRNGDWNVYLPAKIYHLPIAYTAEQRDRYNETPMPGFGIGRGKYIEDGNWHGLYAMEFRDSNDKPSWLAGYARSWLWDMPRLNGGFYGLGFTAFIMGRQDYGNYAPFPAILPSFTLGFKQVELEAVFVPGGKGNGNVFFIWFKLNEKERPHS
ncbi:lipid IV(A) palmitoyltransferase PagP [Niveibacterium umoris]|uniref:Palmitoyl transferase n=1 Tax=Niveibacterium umoris TaxID=1193620 RepID=A0A840BMX8_9RHOO|nr:phospholipid:lipid A palmitoyltransferase [Niveibacterium umoris]MBB4012908.1 palmitoyl transferase [Niveibacterium umoris]